MTWQQTIDEEKEIAREEGLAEGKAEVSREARLETARKMLAKQIPLETVLECTGLTEEDLKEAAAPAE